MNTDSIWLRCYSTYTDSTKKVWQVVLYVSFYEETWVWVMNMSMIFIFIYLYDRKHLYNLLYKILDLFFWSNRWISQIDNVC